MLEKVSKRVLLCTAITALLSACGGSSGSDPDTGAAIDSTSAGNDTAENIESNVSTDTGSNGSADTDSNGSADSEANASDTGSNTTPDTELSAESDSVQKESSVDIVDESDTTDSDNTSDNIEAVTARKVEPPTGFAGAIEPVITPSGSDPFSKFQLDDALYTCLLYTSPSPRDKRQSRMPSSA